jgi:hypothetical protein
MNDFNGFPIIVSQYQKPGEVFIVPPTGILPYCPFGAIVVGEGTDMQHILFYLNTDNQSDRRFLKSCRVRI